MIGLTGGGTGGDDGTVEAGLGDDVNLNGGVATGVVDVASVDLGDTHVGCVFLSLVSLVSWLIEELCRTFDLLQRTR